MPPLKKLLFLLLVILHIANELKSQVYYASADFYIRSKKDIGAFHRNTKALKSLIAHMNTNRKVLHKRGTMAKADSIERTFMIWVEQETSVCIHSLTNKNKRAMEIVSNTFPITKLNSRTTRGIKPLGELVSWVTGVPSPSQWESQNELIDKLKQAIEGNLEEEHLLEKTVSDISKTVIEISKEVDSIINITWKGLNKNQNYIKFYLQCNHKMGLACRKGHLLADTVLQEALDIEDIRVKSRDNKPSEIMFPLKEIFARTKFLRKTHHIPIFSTHHQIESVYSMSIGLTTISENIVHSIIALPLVDYTYMYDYIDPTLSSEELEVISKLSKLARTDLDLILCAKSHSNIKLLSSSRLNMCQKTPDNRRFICKGRRITHINHSFSCNTLPESIAVELSPTKILIKSSKTRMQISCKNLTREINSNTTYSIIKLRPECRLHTQDILVDRIGTNYTSQTILNDKDFELISYDLETPTLESVIMNRDNTSNLRNLTERLRQHTSNLRNFTENLKTDLKLNGEIDRINQERMTDINHRVGWHSTLNWSLGGTLWVILIIVGLAFLIKCCWGRLATDRLNINV